MYSNPHSAGRASSHRGGGVIVGSRNILYKKKINNSREPFPISWGKGGISEKMFIERGI